MTGLHSSAQRMGKKVTQILINNTGAQKTYRNVLTETIEVGKRTKFMTEEGFMVMVRDEETWLIEVHPSN